MLNTTITNGRIKRKIESNMEESAYIISIIFKLIIFYIFVKLVATVFKISKSLESISRSLKNMEVKRIKNEKEDIKNKNFN